MKKIKKWFSLSEFSEKILLLLQRMPASVAIVTGFTVMLLIWIYSDINTSPRIISFCVVGLFISVTAILWLEDCVKNSWLQQLISLLCVVLWSLYCLTLPAKTEQWETVNVLPVVAFGSAFFVSIFFISFLKRNKDKSFWEFSRQVILQIFIAILFSLILFSGLYFAITAIKFLFNVEVSSNSYASLSVFCFAFFAPLYALSGIPDKYFKNSVTPKFDKVLKILGLYILMPLLAIYAVILYAYLIKIIMQWKLPDGYVSWLVSAFSIGGLAVITILYPMQSEKQNSKLMWVLRHFGLLALPLLVLMTIGISRRLHDEGVSINRCYILLLNLWFYGIFLYLYISSARKIKWIFISASFVFLLASIGPWRFSSLVKNTMTKKLETIFKGRQLTLTVANTWFEQASDSDKIIVKKNISYLYDNYGRKSIATFFKENIENSDKWNWYSTILPILGNTPEDRVSSTYRYFDAGINSQINVQGYQTCLSFSWQFYQDKDTSSVQCVIKGDSLIIKNILEKRRFGFTLKPVLMQLKNDNLRNKQPIILTSDGCMLALQGLAADYYFQQDSLNITSVNGILFYK